MLVFQLPIVVEQPRRRRRRREGNGPFLVIKHLCRFCEIRQSSYHVILNNWALRINRYISLICSNKYQYFSELYEFWSQKTIPNASYKLLFYFICCVLEKKWLLNAWTWSSRHEVKIDINEVYSHLEFDFNIILPFIQNPQAPVNK